MKRLTSFTKLTTGEGARIAYTYSEVDEKGSLVSQNNRENFIAVDAELLAHIEAIEGFINTNHLKE